MGWAARDWSFFCHPHCKPKLESILFGLACGHRMDLLLTKAWEHRFTQKHLHSRTVFISLLLEGTKERIWGKACSLHRRCCKVTVAQWQTALGVHKMQKLLFLTAKIPAPSPFHFGLKKKEFKFQFLHWRNQHPLFSCSAGPPAYPHVTSHTAHQEHRSQHSGKWRLFTVRKAGTEGGGTTLLLSPLPSSRHVLFGTLLCLSITCCCRAALLQRLAVLPAAHISWEQRYFQLPA